MIKINVTSIIKKMVRLLMMVTPPIDPNQRDINGKTPLYHSAEMNSKVKRKFI